MHWLYLNGGLGPFIVRAQHLTNLILILSLKKDGLVFSNGLVLQENGDHVQQWQPNAAPAFSSFAGSGKDLDIEISAI